MGICKLALGLPALAALAVIAGDAIAQQRRPEPAQQGFRACNQTGDEIEVAKALNTGATDGRNRIIISEGWYKLPNGACVFLWAGLLEYQHYLVYAQNKATSREWGGKVPICVSRQAFTIRSDTCSSEHYRRSFLEVNTGGEKNLWTHTFRP